MEPLPILLVPSDGESAGGFLLRVLAANGANVKEILALCRGQRRKHLRFQDAPIFAELSGVDVGWFVHRIPKDHLNDRWVEVELFGHRWRGDWLLRGTRQQVCPICIQQDGIARLEWDLVPYAACHIHKVVLQDLCRSCGGALLPDRPAVDVCGCGAFLALHAEEVTPSSEWAYRWCAWLARRFASEVSAGSNHFPAIESRLGGTSPDGAYRLIQAFAGGPRSFQGELLNARMPWLSTAHAHQLISLGCEMLCSPNPSQGSNPLLQGIANGLAEQSVRGITAWDRAIAQRRMELLSVKPRWRNVRPGLQRQLELFDEPLEAHPAIAVLADESSK